jgi:hypothetical protein
MAILTIPQPTTILRSNQPDIIDLQYNIDKSDILPVSDIIDLDIFDEDQFFEQNWGGNKPQIPTNYQEAYRNINYITYEKSGRNNNVYKNKELHAIARNLGLTSHGKKQDLVGAIREAVFSYYGVPDPELMKSKKVKDRK